MENSADRKAADWESLCARCGRCCYEKIDFEGRIYYTGVPCQFLNPVARLCRVYAERDRRRPGCVRLTADNIGKGFLPADCPYVANIANYPAPILADADADDGGNSEASTVFRGKAGR